MLWRNTLPGWSFHICCEDIRHCAVTNGLQHFGKTETSGHHKPCRRATHMASPKLLFCWLGIKGSQHWEWPWVCLNWPLHFADGAMSSHILQLLGVVFDKQGCPIFFPDDTPLSWLLDVMSVGYVLYLKRSVHRKAQGIWRHEEIEKTEMVPFFSTLWPIGKQWPSFSSLTLGTREWK